MAVSLNDLVADVREVIIPTAGGDLHVSYRPSFLTRKMQRRLMAEDVEARVDAYYDLFLSLVSGWDLQDAKGKGIPLTADGVEELPQNVLTLISSACIEDLNAGEASKRA